MDFRRPFLFLLTLISCVCAPLSADEPVLAPLTWASTRPLMFPQPDATHAIVAVKDPTVVFHNNQWHVFSTTADTAGNWSMEYRKFSTWEEATTATPYYLNNNASLRGYHCAPQVFFFKPQNKWYLIYQSQHPTFSTNDDIERPENWTAPQAFFSGTPSSVVNGWIDYWIICDDTHAYLFFSDDHGRFYRSRTLLSSFPSGFDAPVIVMQEAKAGDLFEASCVYKLKGSNKYLCLIECMGGGAGHRYFRAFTADSLNGQWTALPQGASWSTPFLGPNNVVAADGGELWTGDISHGEFLREGNDETMTIDPAQLTFLYQGVQKGTAASSYSQIPWRLALLEPKPVASTGGSRFVNISARAYCAGGDQVVVGGLVVKGTGTKRILVRAVGPALSGYNMPAADLLSDPLLEVRDTNRGNGIIATNDNLSDDANAIATREIAALVGAFPIPAEDTKSAALVLALSEGTYTVMARGKNGATGVVLLEMYEVDSTSPGLFVNMSTRAYVGTNSAVAVGGFVISGDVSKKVLLRAVGSSLVGYGLAENEVLKNGSINLHDNSAEKTIIASNDDWGSNTNKQAIVDEGQRIGAFPLDGTDTQSAVLLKDLQPGLYTFTAKGVGETTGIILIEAYDAD